MRALRTPSSGAEGKGFAVSSVVESHAESQAYQTFVSLNAGLTRWRDASSRESNGLVAKATPMSRVLFATALALAVTGCSQGGQAPSLSLTSDGEKPTSFVAGSRASRQSALGGEPSGGAEPRSRSAGAAGRLASLDDKAPRGSYDTAPKGSLADRDFSSTLLNAELAREQINSYRKLKGLKPLQLNAALTAAAKAHSRDLAKWDRISHFGSDGSNPWDRVKRSGYNAKLAAENVGTGQVSFEEVLKGWKDSPGHNKNLLLSDADHMGIALVHEPKSEFRTFWTLVVGSSL
jgi:uncharacterized protein YkwD